VNESATATGASFCGLTVNVTTAELDAMRGKATGLRNEGEIIVLGIVRLDQVWLKSSDAKLLSSLTLYTNLHALGIV